MSHLDSLASGLICERPPIGAELATSAGASMKIIAPSAATAASLLVLAGPAGAAPAQRPPARLACPGAGDAAELTRGLGRAPDNMLQARDHFVTVYGITKSEERLGDGSLSLVWAAKAKAPGKTNLQPGMTITIRKGSDGLAEVTCSIP